MHPYTQQLVAALKEAADPSQADSMSAYMRGQFSFFGIKTPQRKAILRQFIQQQGLPPMAALEAIIWSLWQAEQRECHYSAMTLLDRRQKKLGVEHLPLIERLIVTHSWWDTVDLLASHQVGDLFQRFPEAQHRYLPQWRTSDNLWLRRTALLFQLKYKEQSDADLLFAIVEENRSDTEFFIQKAIGWALREYSKTDQTAVINFVQQTQLAPLSQREALKWINRQASSNESKRQR